MTDSDEDLMDPVVEHCGNCRQDLAADRMMGLTYCSRCGTTLVSIESPPAEDDPEANDAEAKARERKWMSICFWVLFLATPAAAFLVGVVSTWAVGFLPSALFHVFPTALQVFLTLCAGLLATGYCLTKLRLSVATRADLVAGAILYGFCLVFVYIAIGVVGCSIGSAAVAIYRIFK